MQKNSCSWFKRCILTAECLALLIFLCGCADTGIHSPQKLANQLMVALAAQDVELFAECLIPGGSDTVYSMYNFIGQIGGASARESIDQSLAELKEYSDNYFPELYGVPKGTKTSGCALLLDMSTSGYVAVVHFIGILQIGDRYDYDEMYLSAYKMGNCWYMSSLQDWRPYGYNPDQVFIQNDAYNGMLDKLERNRITPLDPDAGSGVVICGTDVGYSQGDRFGSESIELPNRVADIWDTLGEKEKRLWFDLSMMRMRIEIELDSPTIEAFWISYDEINPFQKGLTSAALVLTKSIEDITGDMIHLVDSSIKLCSSLPAGFYYDHTNGGNQGRDAVIDSAKRYLDSMKFSSTTAGFLDADVDLSKEIIAYLREDVNSYKSDGEYTQNCIDNAVSVYNDPNVKAAISVLKTMNKAKAINAEGLIDFAKVAGFTTWMENCRGIICSGKVMVRGEVINISMELEQLLDFDYLLSGEVNQAELTQFINTVEKGVSIEYLNNTSPNKLFINPKYKDYIYDIMNKSKTSYFGKVNVGKLNTILNFADGFAKSVSAYQMKADSERLMEKWEKDLRNIASNYDGNNDEWMSNVLIELEDNIEYAMANSVEAFITPFAKGGVNSYTSAAINESLKRIAPTAAKGASSFLTAMLLGVDIGVGMTGAKDTHGKVPNLQELSDHYFLLKEDILSAFDAYIQEPSSEQYEQLRMQYLLYSIARGSTCVGIHQIFINEEESIRNRAVNGAIMSAEFCLSFFNAFQTGYMEQVPDRRKDNIKNLEEAIDEEVRLLNNLEELLFPYES